MSHRIPCERHSTVQAEKPGKSILPMLGEAHDWAHLPPSFHRNIEQGYVVVQGDDLMGVGYGG